MYTPHFIEHYKNVMMKLLSIFGFQNLKQISPNDIHLSENSGFAPPPCWTAPMTPLGTVKHPETVS